MPSGTCLYNICLSSIGLSNLCLIGRWLSRNRLCVCLFGLRLDLEKLRRAAHNWTIWFAHYRTNCVNFSAALLHGNACTKLFHVLKCWSKVPFQQCYILRYYFVLQWHSIITYNNAKFSFTIYPSNPNLVVVADRIDVFLEELTQSLSFSPQVRIAFVVVFFQ